MSDSPARSEPTARQQSNDALKRALLAAQTAEENRGTDVVVLDLRELTAVFDYFVLGQRHKSPAVARHKRRDRSRPGRSDGRSADGHRRIPESRWILLDYGDVVVHLFEPETRAYYALEELWGHAKRVPLAPQSA